MLGHVVAGAGVVRREPRDRGCVDDMAFRVLGKHNRHERANAVDNTPDINTYSPFPGRQTALPNGAVRSHPGVVAQDMHRPKGFDRRFGEGFYLLRL